MSIEKDIKEIMEAFPMPQSEDDKKDGYMGKSISPIPSGGGNIFKPVPKEEIAQRQADTLKRLATPEVKQAIEVVLDYLYHDEVKSWEEDNEEGAPLKRGHILYFLTILADAVGWSDR